MTKQQNTSFNMATPWTIIHWSDGIHAGRVKITLQPLRNVVASIPYSKSYHAKLHYVASVSVAILGLQKFIINLSNLPAKSLFTDAFLQTQT